MKRPYRVRLAITGFAILALVSLGLFGWGNWTTGRFGVPKMQLGADGRTLSDGRTGPAWLLSALNADLQEESLLVLSSLALCGAVGLRWNHPKPQPVAVDPFDLSTPLLWLSEKDPWTIGDSTMGTLILGATGAGKTSGPGAHLARAFLRAGYGALILCVKNDEGRLWQDYCRETNRLDDLIVIDASCRQRYSFLDQEVQRAGIGSGLTENISRLFSVVLEIADGNGSSGARESEPFWRRSSQQLVRNLVDLLRLAEERITVPSLYLLATSAPTSLEQLQSESWRQSSYCFQCLQKADARQKSPRDLQDFRIVAEFFTNEFATLSDRTRSVILSTFTSLADVMNRGLLRDLFSSDTTVRPEDALGGKIIVLDLAVKEFGETGQLAGVLFKYCFQRAVERRNLSDSARPVFLWVDEFQHFCVESDMLFQTTARSSRVATVLLTQNTSTLLASFGGDNAQAVMDSLAGNLQTKLMCANGDAVTNDWAARMVGQSRSLFLNANQSQPNDLASMLFGMEGQQQGTAGVSEQLDFEVPPRTFTTLRCGGPSNHWQVDVIAFQGGRRFAANGKTWLPITFQQRH